MSGPQTVVQQLMWSSPKNLESPGLYELDRPAMSNKNGLLSQKLCHYLDQGRTLNDI